MKEKIRNFHDSLFKTDVIDNKKKRILFLLVFYLTLASTFITIVGQVPRISAAGATKFFQIGWAVVLIPMIFLDYKQFTRAFVTVFLVSCPFLIYELVLLPLGINSISYQGTIYVFLVLFIFLQGMILGKYLNFKFLKALALSYLAAALIYAVFVYIERLHGHVGDTEIYAFDDKNSAGPIFLVAALLPFMLFQKNTIATVIVKIVNFCGFSLILLIAKCRATLVFLPIALLLIHIFLPKKKKFKIIATGSLAVAMGIGITLLFTVPYLYQKIVVHFIFNDKHSIQELFSGRIERITEAFKLFSDTKILLLGKGFYYLDCMPISILLTYGVIGTVLLLPVFVLPVYSVIKSKKYLNHKGTFFTVTLIILLSLYFNGLFEGYGFIGTGTKVFILWLLAGYSYTFVVEDVKVKHLCNFIDKPAKASMKLKANYFSLILLAVIAGASCGLLSSTSTSEFIGQNIFKFSSAYKTVANYVAPKSMDIDRNHFKTYLNNQMCVGQEIKFKTIIDPIEVDETVQEWTKGWTYPNCIDILNKEKGIVKAIKSTPNRQVSTLCVHYPIYSNSKYIQYQIKEIDEYSFDNIFIDNKPINYSFETLDNHKDINEKDIEINLRNGCTTRIYYDKFYFPVKSGQTTTSFEFESSDTSIATIDSNGDVRARKAGDCTITAKGIVNNKEFLAKNKIKIKVTDFTPVPIIDFGCSMNSADQYIKYKLNDFVTFKPFDCTDKSFDVNVKKNSGIVGVNDYTYNPNTTEITFNKPGEYVLNLTSRFDSTKTINKTINVLANNPIKISSDLSWAVIGNKYNVTQLGLKLFFERGWKYLESGDLYYNYHNNVTYGRATSSKSGLCDGSLTTFKAVKAGTFSYTYICKYNQEIKYTMIITSNVYSKPVYTQACQNIGLIFVFAVLVLGSLYLFCVQINSKFLYILTTLFFVGTITVVTILIYPLNQFSIGCIITFSAVVLIISLIRLTAMNNKAVKLIS